MGRGGEDGRDLLLALCTWLDRGEREGGREGERGRVGGREKWRKHYAHQKITSRSKTIILTPEASTPH